MKKVITKAALAKKWIGLANIIASTIPKRRRRIACCRQKPTDSTVKNAR